MFGPFKPAPHIAELPADKINGKTTILKIMTKKHTSTI